MIVSLRANQFTKFNSYNGETMDKKNIFKKFEIKNKVVKETVEWILCFVIAYAIYLVISNVFGTVAGIKQSSMYPTCEDGQKVVISSRLLYNKEINRGDIVILQAPSENHSVDSNNVTAFYIEHKGLSSFTYNIMNIGKRSYIKRVIAVSGDHLFISEDGRIYVNDILQEEAYLPKQYTPRTGLYYDLVVPEGQVFVMGDNRMGSMDSRKFGCVPEDKIDGKVICRIWPLNKIGKIDK